MYGSGAATGMIRVITKPALAAIPRAHPRVSIASAAAVAGAAGPVIAGALFATSTFPATGAATLVFVSPARLVNSGSSILLSGGEDGAKASQSESDAAARRSRTHRLWRANFIEPNSVANVLNSI